MVWIYVLFILGIFLVVFVLVKIFKIGGLYYE